MSTKTPIATTHEPLLSDEQVWAIVDKWQRSDDTEWDCACNATCDAMDHYEKDRRSNLSRIAELEAQLEAMRAVGDSMRDAINASDLDGLDIDDYTALVTAATKWSAKEQPPTPTT